MANNDPFPKDDIKAVAALLEQEEVRSGLVSKVLYLIDAREPLDSVSDNSLQRVLEWLRDYANFELVLSTGLPFDYDCGEDSPFSCVLRMAQEELSSYLGDNVAPEGEDYRY